MTEIKEGYIVDFISGQPVRETPEEVEAVQPFSKILVDDYGYPKEYIYILAHNIELKFAHQTKRKNIQ